MEDYDEDQFAKSEREFLVELILVLITLAVIVLYMVYVFYLSRRQLDRYRVKIVVDGDAETVEVIYPED
ncbi:hypothetical protein L596_020568 [Steinernema carpocapsae]|uniref:Uncharacterized protein n=1 Tax=Steinernema carpocapsae TaxID=34508 RepID=A0A4U5MUP4_STECR|nr:hypothetical protein L596_020568 [Steinernema carpocapsae]